MEQLGPSDEAAFVRALSRIGLTDPGAVAAGLGLCYARTLRRGEYLLRGGEQATLAGVLVSGLLREHFLTKKGVERTKSFILPLQFTGSLADLLSGKPSRAFIVAEEPSRLVLLPYAELCALEPVWPAWSAMGRRSIEHLLLYKAEREYDLLCMDAEERYAAFVARHPDLEVRVKASHIASFLGMTSVHLSRLRARRARRRS